MKLPSRNLIILTARPLPLLLVLVSSAFATEPTKETIEQVQRSVVVVNTYDANGRSLAIGSGFFIERDRLVTNAHVIKKASQATIRTFDGRVYSIRGILALNEKNDLALLQTSVPIGNITLLSIAARFLREGERITVISVADDSSWKVSSGTTQSLWYLKGIGEYLRISAEIVHGNSGSPVVNGRGEVIGVAALHLNGTESLNFAVPGELIKSLRAGPLKSLPRSRALAANR